MAAVAGFSFFSCNMYKNLNLTNQNIDKRSLFHELQTHLLVEIHHLLVFMHFKQKYIHFILT